MASFEFLKAKYQVKLMLDKEFVDKVTENSEDPEFKELSEIVLHPKNENEIIVGEAFHTYWKSLLSLHFGVVYEDMKDGYLNDMFGVQKEIEMIKAVQAGECDAKTFWKKLPVADRARADVDMLMVTLSNPLGSARYIGEQVGKNFNYLSAPEEFEEFRKKLGIDIKNPFQEIDTNDLSQVREAVEYAKEFTNAVNANKAHHKSDRVMFFRNVSNLRKK